MTVDSAMLSGAEMSDLKDKERREAGGKIRGFPQASCWDMDRTDAEAFRRQQDADKYTRQWAVHVGRITDWLTCQYDTHLGEKEMLGDLKVDCRINDETPTGPSGLNLDSKTGSCRMIRGRGIIEMTVRKPIRNDRLVLSQHGASAG
jgi:hypothetical protein